MLCSSQSVIWISLIGMTFDGVVFAFKVLRIWTKNCCLFWKKFLKSSHSICTLGKLFAFFHLKCDNNLYITCLKREITIKKKNYVYNVPINKVFIPSIFTVYAVYTKCTSRRIDSATRLWDRLHIITIPIRRLQQQKLQHTHTQNECGRNGIRHPNRRNYGKWR